MGRNMGRIPIAPKIAMMSIASDRRVRPKLVGQARTRPLTDEGRKLAKKLQGNEERAEDRGIAEGKWRNGSLSVARLRAELQIFWNAPRPRLKRGRWR